MILALISAQPEIIDDVIALLTAYKALMVKINALKGSVGG
jgi:hypothetical protein